MISIDTIKKQISSKSLGVSIFCVDLIWNYHHATHTRVLTPSLLLDRNGYDLQIT